MKKAKFASLALAAVLAAGALAGCGGGSSSTPASAGSTGAPASGGEKQVIEIAVFEGGLGGEYWEQMMAAYQAEHPNVEFKSTISPKVGEIIRPRIVSGDAPDLLVMTDGDASGLLVSMIKDKALLDITDVFEGPAYDSDTPLKDVILPGYLDSKKFQPYGDGKIYIAPKDCGYSGMVYNKALFEAKGWAVPETWDEFFALGDLAKAEGRALFTYQGIYPSYLESLLWPAIADVVGAEGINSIFNYEEGSFNNPGVVSVLANFQKIASGGYLMDGTLALNHTQSQTEMMQGHALFIPNGIWMINEMKDAPREDGFSYGLACAPAAEKGGTRYTLANYGQISIPKDAKNPEGAKDFLRFLYTAQSAQLMAEKSSTVLAIQGGAELAKDYLEPDAYNMFQLGGGVKALFNDFATLPTGSKVDVSQTVFENAMTKLMSEQVTPTECAEIVEKAFAQIRDEQAKLGA